MKKTLIKNLFKDLQIVGFEKVGLDHFKDPKAFVEYSNDMEDVYKNIENYNPGKKCKILMCLMT